MAIDNIVLIRRIQAGDSDAEGELVVKNKNLCFWYAKRYHRLYNNKVEIKDLMQAASIGLLIAARRFDLANHGDKKFSTYASYYVRNEINGLIAEVGFSATVPMYVVSEIGKFHLYDMVERKYNYEEIIAEAETMGLPVNRAVDVSKAIYRFLHSPSLDEYDNENDDYLFETIVNENINDVESEIEEIEFLKCINDIVGENGPLSEKERVVLDFRFGFVGDGHEYSLREVGRILSLSQERIRQLETRSLCKLRKPVYAHLLQSYIA